MSSEVAEGHAASSASPWRGASLQNRDKHSQPRLRRAKGADVRPSAPTHLSTDLRLTTRLRRALPRVREKELCAWGVSHSGTAAPGPASPLRPNRRDTRKANALRYEKRSTASSPPDARRRPNRSRARRPASSLLPSRRTFWRGPLRASARDSACAQCTQRAGGISHEPGRRCNWCARDEFDCYGGRYAIETRPCLTGSAIGNVQRVIDGNARVLARRLTAWLGFEPADQ